MCRVPDPADEAELIRSVQCYLAARRRGEAPGPGPEAAWGRFHRAYGPLVRQFAAERCPPGCEPEDCEQEAWCRLIGGLGHYRCDGPPGAFRSWLRALVRHTRSNLARGRRPAVSLDPATSAALAGREPDPAEACAAAERAALVRLGLEALRPRVARTSFRVLCLHALEGRPAPEVAATLGLSPGAVRVRQHRTLRAFAGLLAPLADDGLGCGRGFSPVFA